MQMLFAESSYIAVADLATWTILVIIVIVMSFCTIVIVGICLVVHGIRVMSKSHMIIHVMLLYCTYRIIANHHLSKSMI